MKPFISLSLSLCLCLFAYPVQSSPPSTDDFLPPIQASTPDQRAQLSQVQGEVRESRDPATGQLVAEGNTAQDTINFVVNKHSAGAEMVKFNSGSGWVATGADGYAVMENPTATRLAKRYAYVKAFMEAKKNLAEALSGLGSDDRAKLMEQMEQVTVAKADLAHFAHSQNEKPEQAVQMLLKGFVVYAVEDDTANNTVYVSIVTTPKTRGQFNRPLPKGLEADSIRDGLRQVLLEIQTGLIPPIGGRIIQVPATGEIGLVGFGSDVVRISDNAALQLKMRLNAVKVAQMRARDALIGMIIGDDTSWTSKLDDNTRNTIKNFDSSDSNPDASLQRFEKTYQNFLVGQKTTEQYQSARSGVLPPGVTIKTFTSKDDAEVYAAAIYLPSVSQQATQTAREMSQTQWLGNPGDTGSADMPAARGDNPQRPKPGVAPGPTGQVSHDQDL